jgi:hypothetical protein
MAIRDALADAIAEIDRTDIEDYSAEIQKEICDVRNAMRTVQRKLDRSPLRPAPTATQPAMMPRKPKKKRLKPERKKKGKGTSSGGDRPFNHPR